MALTATVTPPTRASIMDSLCMDKESSFVLERLPNRLNISYEVQLKPCNSDIVVTDLVHQVQEHGIKAPKTIVFCRTYKDLTEMAACLVSQLHSRGLFLARLPDGGQTPLCEMYTGSTDDTIFCLPFLIKMVQFVLFSGP